MAASGKLALGAESANSLTCDSRFLSRRVRTRKAKYSGSPMFSSCVSEFGFSNMLMRLIEGFSCRCESRRLNSA